MHQFVPYTARYAVLPIENIDTDQIIPARFLKTTDKTGLGESLFADWRYDSDGRPKAEFLLNQSFTNGVEVLVAGTNFGCGSSREHAPWALQGFGFKAVMSTYFADIFQNNALKNGLLPIVITPQVYDILVNADTAHPGQARVSVDLATQTVTLPNGATMHFPIEPFAKYCVLNGVDQMGFLMNQDKDIQTYETAHPARVNTIGL
ncbi:MAG: 3-isopropylmalate dehydratase small subunit [Roseiflexaceae bacterium]|jgi:3-isopropylmalate/(R)-2-methylmalate dehydratase small subunit|nr:3-isopropylmalate dehydratase small subunit [Chloroflexaceae bacterium]